MLSRGNPEAALFWCQDRWECGGSFSITQRASGPLLRDKEGQTLLTISVHFPNEPELQQQLWDRLAAVRRSFEAFPFLLLSDHNSILLPMEDDLNVWKGGPPVVESQSFKEARTAEARVMSRLGLLDAWRHIYDEVDDDVAVGATRGHSLIDRILLSFSYGALLGGAFMMGAGKSDHQAVAVRLVPECSMGGPRRWRLPAHYLGDGEFKQGVQRIMGEISTVREWNGGILCSTVSSSL